jgi:hypothetical protein
MLDADRVAGALGNVNAEPLATGLWRYRAIIVDADVAIERANRRSGIPPIRPSPWWRTRRILSGLC